MTEAKTAKIDIYWGSGSTPAWKVLIAANEKGLQYNSHLLSFDKKETHTAEFLKLNPRGKVPVYCEGDIVLYESNAILLFIEAHHKEKALLPKADKPIALGMALMRLQETNNLNEAITDAFRMHLNKEKTDESMKTKVDALLTELGYWEQYLKLENTGFLVGGTITLADIALFPYLAFLNRQGADFRNHPNLAAFHKSMLSRESVKSSLPPHWANSKGYGAFTTF